MAAYDKNDGEGQYDEWWLKSAAMRHTFPATSNTGAQYGSGYSDPSKCRKAPVDGAGGVGRIVGTESY